MTIKIKKVENKIKAYSPYNPDLPKRARNLGGKWNGACWVFDYRDEKRVRELYIEIYGTDGSIATGDLVTLRVTTKDFANETLYWYADKAGLYFAGRSIAYATGRDSGARLSEGVILIKGGFTSGGSMKNWETKAKSCETIFELRDVPRKKALETIEEEKDTYFKSIEIIENKVNVDALMEEKKALLARIKEIETLLNGNSGDRKLSFE